MGAAQADGPGGARLVVSGGPLDATEYPVPKSADAIVVGSSNDAGIRILLGNVEPVHASLSWVEGELVVADVGSEAGTFVNGDPVWGERAVRDGDQVCLGAPGERATATLIVRLSQPAAAAGLGADDGIAPPALSEEGDAPAFALAEPPAALAVEAESPEVPEAQAAAGASPVFVAEAPVAEPPANLPTQRAPESAADVRPRPEPLRFAPEPERDEAAPQPASTESDAMPTPEGRTSASDDGVSEHPGEFPALRPPRTRKRSPSAAQGSWLRRHRAPVIAAVGGLAVFGGALLSMSGVFRSSPPQVVRVTPAETAPGQVIKVSGHGFASEATDNTVKIGGLEARVSAASPSELEVVVPAAAKSQVPLVVQTRRGASLPLLIVVIAPGVPSGIEPDLAWDGQTILVRGEKLDVGPVSVQVAGREPRSVEPGAEGIRVVIPSLGLPEGSRASVSVTAGAVTRSFELFVGHAPLLLALEPKSGRVGHTVVLHGRGFDPEPRVNAVTFSGKPAAVLAASSRELQVSVPAAAAGADPELQVAVAVAGQASRTSQAFQLSTGGSSRFQPRFFADAVAEVPGEDVAFVSTEIGPVLLMGGDGGAASAAEKAAAVAARLNALVARPSAGAPSFELREAAQPAVFVSGDARPLAIVTAAEVAAYARFANARSRKPSAAAIARHWTALLQDYLGLFLARERPVQMLALSPEARILTDIHAEAARRARGETGVPMSLLTSADGAKEAALRRLALGVSAEPPQPAAVVEGRWQLRIDDPDRVPRDLRAELRSDAGRLAGTLSTASGLVEMRSPLREVAFQGGTLRFVADLQGAACTFSGTLRGTRVSGNVERPGKPAVPFTMDYVE